MSYNLEVLLIRFSSHPAELIISSAISAAFLITSIGTPHCAFRRVFPMNAHISPLNPGNHGKSPRLTSFIQISGSRKSARRRSTFGYADPDSRRIDAPLNAAFNLGFPPLMATRLPVAMRKISPELVYHIAFLSIATVNLIS
jgi:hypothetical protein